MWAALLLFVCVTVAQKCKLLIPENPLINLTTPYELEPPCTMQNPDMQAFVEAVLFDTVTQQIRVYTPIVTDRNTPPAAPPTPITIAPTEIVALWFGFNGETLELTQRMHALRDGNCVNGLDRSFFGQFAYCNAIDWLAAAGDCPLCAIPVGIVDFTGDPCPTVWDFFIVDADPSDNLPMSYLLTQDGQTAQDTAENRQRLAVTNIASNPSDEGLLSLFINPAIGCAQNTVKIPDATDPGTSRATLITNEIQARLRQNAPFAYLPDRNPMVLVKNKINLQKLSLYRQGIGQPLDAPFNTTEWCRDYAIIAPLRFFKLQGFLRQAPTPNAELGINLFTFLCARFANSFEVLKCPGKLPIKLIGDAPFVDCIRAK